jgi:peptidoglycan/xylan/chitin deacetylase (PgdA/CDA1 family)
MLNDGIAGGEVNFVVDMKKIAVLLLLIFSACAGPDEYEGEGGVILSFDDRYFTQWKQNGFPLFAKYDAKVTFFVMHLDSGGSDFNFCREAQDLGHEIGYHTVHHLDVTTLSVKDLLSEAVDHIPMFKEEGINLSSFSYPFGNHNAKTTALLLRYYRVLSGTAHYPRYHLYSKDQMKSGFVYATSLDNVHHNSGEVFKHRVTKMLEAAKRQKRYILLYTHEIGTTRDWGITLARLEFVLQKCWELGLKFYTFKDLQ